MASYPKALTVPNFRSPYANMYRLAFRAALVARVIELPYCRKIIKLMSDTDRPMQVTEIWKRMRVAQPVVSRHLVLLLKYDIIEGDLRHKNHFYSLNIDRLRQIAAAVDRFVHPDSGQSGKRVQAKKTK